MSLKQIKFVVQGVECSNRNPNADIVGNILICNDCLVYLTTEMTLVENIVNAVKNKISTVLSHQISINANSPLDLRKKRLNDHLCQEKPLYVSCNKIGKDNMSVTVSLSNICDNPDNLDDVL